MTGRAEKIPSLTVWEKIPDQRLQVLMVIERYWPIWGGAENQLKQLCSHLAGMGHGLEIITRRWSRGMQPFETVDGISVRRVGLPIPGLIGRAAFAVAMSWYVLRCRNNVDVLHAHGNAGLGALCATVTSLVKMRCLVKIATSGRLKQLRKKSIGRTVLKLLRRADGIVCISSEIEEELRIAGIESSRIIKVANAVDCDRFYRLSDTVRQTWRRDRGFSENDSIVVFTGRLVERKGLDTLLTAWQHIVKTHPNAQLLLIGSGAGQTDSVEATLREAVERRAIPNVHFEGQRSDPEIYLGVSDIFVFPSRLEGMPNAILEAMAAGLPIVATRIGGVVDLVKDRECGLLVNVDDAESLAEALALLVKSPTKRHQFGKAARSFVETRYAFDAVASAYLKFYCNQGANGSNESMRVSSNCHYYSNTLDIKPCLPLKVLFLVGGEPKRGLNPSSRFRVYAYQSRFNGDERFKTKISPSHPPVSFYVKSFYQKRSALAKILVPAGILAMAIYRLKDIISAGFYDVVVLQRTLLPGKMFPLLEIMLSWVNSRIVFDFDDAIYLYHYKESGERRSLLYRLLEDDRNVERILKRSALALAGNALLAQYAEQHCENVQILPTMIDWRHYCPLSRSKSQSKRRIRIGWIGTSGNLPYIEALAPVLKKLQIRHDLILCIVCNPTSGRPAFSGVRVEWNNWSANDELALLQSFDIGLMPLPDDEWERGKCGLKLLQYLSCAIPAVASDVGVNREIIIEGVTGFLASNDAEWGDKIERLIIDDDLRMRMGQRGRSRVQNHYSLDIGYATLTEALLAI